MKSSGLFTKSLSKSFYYGFGSILGKLFGFVMLPIYTQFLSPEEYGAIGMLLVFNSIIQIIFGSQLEQGITYFYYNSKHRIQGLWQNSVSITTILLLIPLTVVVFKAEYISEVLLGTVSYKNVVAIFSLNILFIMLETYGFLFLRLTELYKKYLLFSVMKLFIQAGLNIYLIVILQVGVIGVAISAVVGAGFAVLATSYLPIRDIKFRFWSIKLIRKLVRYCYPLWLTGFIAMYVSSAPQVLLGRLYSLADLGLYNLAMNFAILIGVFFWNPFFLYWQTERFKIFKQDDRNVIYNKFFKTSFILSLLLCFGLAVLGKPAIEIMADEAFHSAHSAIFPLSLFTIARYLEWYFNFGFLIKEKTGENLKNNIFKALLITSLGLLLIPKYGFLGASWALAISGISTVVYCFIRSKRYYDMEINFGLYFMILICFVVGYAAIDKFILTEFQGTAELICRLVVCVIAVLISGFGVLYYNGWRRPV